MGCHPSSAPKPSQQTVIEPLPLLRDSPTLLPIVAPPYASKILPTDDRDCTQHLGGLDLDLIIAMAADASHAPTQPQILPPCAETHEAAPQDMEPATVTRGDAEAWAKELAIQRLFLALDQNGDGAVDVQEYWVFLRIGLGLSGSTLRQAEEAMFFKDFNNDGLLAFEEFAESCAGMDAAAILRLCEPLEREAGLQVYHSVQVEPHRRIMPSPFLFDGRCSHLCSAFPATETHELIVTSKKSLEPSKQRDNKPMRRSAAQSQSSSALRAR